MRIPLSPAAAFAGLMLSPLVTGQELSVRLDELDLSQATAGFGQVRKDRSSSNRNLSIGGQAFEHGVGTHAPGEMLFALDGGPARFEAQVGIDDGTDGAGSVVFQVLADGQPVYDSGLIRKGEAAKKIDVDLKGRKRIELRVTDGGDGKNFDHADWADARFHFASAPPLALPRWSVDLPHYTGDLTAAFPATEPPGLESPDRSVAARLRNLDGRLWLQVDRAGRPALDPSPLGMTVDGIDLGKDAQLGEPQPYSGDTSYEWLGSSSRHRDHFTGFRCPVTSGPVRWTLNVRAYDDGIAWRYELPTGGSHQVSGESTAFVLPEKAVYWTHHDTRAYEGDISRFTIEGDAPKRAVAMPVTVELPGGGFVCITEADTMAYSGMSLGPQGRALKAIFEDDPKGWTMDGPFTSPWRVAIAVPDLDALVNSSIVANVCPPPDPKLFPHGIHEPWAAPGRAYWTWFFGGNDTAKWDRIKGYIDDAAALGCQYYVIDDPWRNPSMGWHRQGHDEWASLKEFCDYAATRKVKLMVWQHWESIRNLPERERFFDQVAKAGAAGVKIDFMESESHDRLAFYHSCLELGARRHLIVNLHGANKPAGEERTWPNALTREGIRGLEQRGGLSRQHLAALPFNRLVTGPGDFTPTTFRPDQLYSLTAGTQLATAVAYPSPLQHWADSADVYLKQPPEVIDFIRTKPVVWDETRVLPGSRIGELAAIARRSGKDWWIAAINGTDRTADYRFTLDFLKEAGAATLFRDDAADKTRLSIESRRVGPAEAITAPIAPGGGFTMIIRGGR